MNEVKTAQLLSGVGRQLHSLSAYITCVAHVWSHADSDSNVGNSSNRDLLAEVIAPRGAKLDTLALENLAQSLTLSLREPVALEVLGSVCERRLLVRATTARSLAHVCAQIRAHTPQAETRPVVQSPYASLSRSCSHSSADRPGPATHLSHVQLGEPSTLHGDPLDLRAAERVRAVDLRPQAAAHLPLKLYQERELGATGVDPLLGVFAAMDGLPSGVRVVAQLAVAPAPDTWSRMMQRLAVEHPLARERAQEAAWTATSRPSSSAGSPAAALPLVPLLALLGVVVLAQQVRQHWHWPAHPDPRWLLLTVASGIAVIALGIFVVTLVARLRHRQVYDMRLVEERTSRIAARSRLMLFAIGPTAPVQALSPQTSAHGSGEDGRSSDASGERDGMKVLHAPTSAPASDGDRVLDDALDHLVAAYRQHHLASGNGFAAHRLSSLRTRSSLKRWSRQVRHSHFLLNARELAALWHVPAGDAEVPLLERTRARAVLAPALPLASGYRIGSSRAGGHVVSVHLPIDLLRRNALLVAKTGKGKSTLLLHLALATLHAHSLGEDGEAKESKGTETAVDASSAASASSITTLPSATTTFGAISPARRGGANAGVGASLAVVDPHGDLVNALLGLIPPARHDDVVLVDLADTAYPVALNPLDVRLGRDRDKAVENLLRIFAAFWSRAWGTRMQNALEFALKTLYEANEALIAADPEGGADRQYTLLDVAPMLTAPSFRHAVLSTVTDDALLAWWAFYYEPLERRFQQEIINPVQTKMASFAGSRVARRIVGQARSTLDLAEMVREGRILLVNTAKGVVGADTAALVGATLIGTLAAALEEQARHDPTRRRPLRLLVDEFQTIPGVDYGAMLSELRKFGGTFVLSTQALGHLDALDRALRPTVLANVDALYTFATSAEDARVLVRELDDTVEIADLINLDDYVCYAKLTCDGRRLPVFSVALDPAPGGVADAAQHIRRRTRGRYAHPVAEADAVIAALAERSHPAAMARRRSSGARTVETASANGAVAVSGDDDPSAEPKEGGGAAVAESGGTGGSSRGVRQRGRYGQRSPKRRTGLMSQPFPLWDTATMGDSGIISPSTPDDHAHGAGDETGRRDQQSDLNSAGNGGSANGRLESIRDVGDEQGTENGAGG